METTRAKIINQLLNEKTNESYYIDMHPSAYREALANTDRAEAEFNKTLTPEQKELYRIYDESLKDANMIFADYLTIVGMKIGLMLLDAVKDPAAVIDEIYNGKNDERV